MADFLSGFAETQPRGIFANVLTKQRKPVQDFFANRFNDLYNEYLGQLEVNPTQGFGGFLSGQKMTNRLMTYSPQQRGIYNRTLQPPTRFLNY